MTTGLLIEAIRDITLVPAGAGETKIVTSPVGPAGPPGEQGLQGPEGPQGPPGELGEGGITLDDISLNGGNF